mmetsp:Transcript_24610/g.81075  ORF Transcript_24610/g.81075 Transcript_24610/m.81075 type:complete len:207 (-) Transcript_24610:648-1268(-)
MRLATGDVKLRGLHRPWQPRRWQRPVGVAPREQHGHRFDERRLVRRHGAGRGQLQLRRWRWRGPSRSGGASGAHQQGRVWHRAAFREAGRLRSTGAAAARAVGGELQRVRIPLRQGRWAVGATERRNGRAPARHQAAAVHVRPVRPPRRRLPAAKGAQDGQRAVLGRCRPARPNPPPGPARPRGGGGRLRLRDNQRHVRRQPRAAC